MTTDDAYAIQLYLAELEFPKVFSTAVFFALFKVLPRSQLSFIPCENMATSLPSTFPRLTASQPFPSS